MAETAKPRDATWDVARGIGMIVVIYGHLIEALYPARPGKELIVSALEQWIVIYAFHMPLFFYISGAVNRSLPGKPMLDVVRGALRLLALAWIVHFIGLILLMLCGYVPDATRSLADAANAFTWPLLYGEGWSVGVMWFLTALCFVQLLAFVGLKFVHPLILAAAAILVGAWAMGQTNHFLFRTWFPGLALFALGFWATQKPIMPVLKWLGIPLLLATIFLAPMNGGCSFTWAAQCPNEAGRYGVRMFAGQYGFLPMFYLTALAGTLGVVGLAALLAPFRAAALLAYIGRNSLDLLILNGLFSVLVSPLLQKLALPPLNALHYLLMAIAVVAAHLLALLALAPLLRWVNLAAEGIAGKATALVGLLMPARHAS